MTSKPHTDLTVVYEPRLRDLNGYWVDKCHGRSMPARADIDPVELKRHLANLVLVDVSGPPSQFRFRLAGTDIVARYGAELTGRNLNDIDLGSDLAAIKEQYEATVLERTPTYCRHFIETKKRKHLNYERLLMPLSEDGSTVNMLLGGIYPLPPEVVAAAGEAAAANRNDDGRGAGQAVVLLKARSA